MNGKTILIVEDKDEFRKIYGDRLRFGGYEVLDASDGNEALKVLEEKKVDLVITDLNMPNKDGYELIKDIRAGEKTKSIPVVVMSVFDQAEHLKQATDLGADDYLVKGMTTPNEVLEKIKKYIA